jgi:hypothetical protein
MGQVENAIYHVLHKVGKMSDESIADITSKVMEKTKEFGRDIPPFNLLWMTISQNSIYSMNSSQEMAQYILEMIETGTYKTELEKTIDRINQVMVNKP